MNSVARSAAAAALLIMSLTTQGHHNTGAMFNLDDEVQLSGTVTRYEWKNPHVYFFVEVPAEGGNLVEWEVEAGPVAFMHRFGWHRRSLVPGESVELVGNPSKHGANEVNLIAARKAGGESLPASRGADVAALFMNPVNDGEQAESLDGTWITAVNEAIALFEDENALPLTPAARQAHAEFDENTMHPGLTCTPIPAPMMMAVPDTKRIEIQPDRVLIKSDFDATERTVYLDGRDGAPSIHGHSLGRFDGEVLHVVTRQFVPVHTGIGFGVPSSVAKQLVERFSLAEDRRSLTYWFEVSDPEMLSEPVSAEVRWSFEPTATLTNLACDRENASRFAKHAED